MYLRPPPLLQTHVGRSLLFYSDANLSSVKISLNLLHKLYIMENPEFNSRFTVKWPDNHSIEHLKFVFSQAEKRLDESHKTFETTTTKSVTLITLIVALLSALTAYFFVNNDFSGVFSPKLFSVFVVSVYIFFVLIYIVKNILPHDYQPSGSSPSSLLTECPQYDISEKELKQELHLKDVYYSELVGYDKRIEHNFTMNNPRLERIRISINMLIYMPVLGLLIYTITFFLS